MSPVTGKRRLDARQMPTPTPTAAPERTASRPNMGPLTTDFKAPDHCTRVALACPTCTNAFLGRSCKADATGTIAPTPEDDAACWPTATAWPRSGHQPFAGFGIYSPAVQCPTGYTSACGAIQTKASNNDFKFQFPLEAGEEAIGCCPQGYECAMHEAFGWQTCRQVVTSTQVEAFECGAGGSSKAVEAFAIPFTRDAVTFATMDLWAPMLQIVHQPTDVPQSVASKAESSSSSSPTSIAAKPAKDHKKQSGLTTGEAIGIAISPAIIALIAVLVFFFFWKKRRNAPPAQPQQPRDLDAAAAVPPPPIPGAAARNLASSKDSFRSNDTDSTKVPSVKGSPTPDGKPSPAPTHTPIYDEQVKLRRETVDPFFLADHEKPPKTPDSSYFDAWQGSDPVPPVPPLRGVYDYEKGQYSNADPEPMYMPPQPIQATPPMSQNPYTYERTHFPNSPEPAAFPNTPGNEPGPTIRNNDVNPYEGYGYGDGYGDSDYPLSPEMFPAPPGMRNEQTTRGYDSPIDSSSPFRLKRGDTGDSIRRYSEESDIGNQIPRAVWADDERTPRASHESTWPTMLNKNDSFSRPRPPGSYSPPQRQSPLAFPAPAGSLSPPPPPPPEPKTASWSPETQQHEWKNPMRRADSFSRPRPRNLTPPTSPPMTSQSGDQGIDARIMDPTGMAK